MKLNEHVGIHVYCIVDKHDGWLRVELPLKNIKNVWDCSKSQ